MEMGGTTVRQLLLWAWHFGFSTLCPKGTAKHGVGPAISDSCKTLRRALAKIVAVLLFAPLAEGGSVTSFSSASWSHAGTACSLCHAGSTTNSIQPAWRKPASPPLYIPYSSATLKARVGQPSSVSLICLSCHDGTLTVDNCGGTMAPRASSKDGNDLRRSHPVSFTYDSALAQKSGTVFDPGSRRVPGLGGKTVREVLLFENKLECPSCHDVHKLKGASAYDPHDLIIPNIRSQLCFTCHDM